MTSSNDLVIGTYFKNILCENFLDDETGRIRVRPIKGQGIPENTVIECSRAIRERHPLHTRFLAIELKVCTKPLGGVYLRAKDQMIFKIDK